MASWISNKPVGSALGLGQGQSAITNQPVGKMFGLGQGQSAITNLPVGTTAGLAPETSQITNKPVGATLRLDPPSKPTPEVSHFAPLGTSAIRTAGQTSSPATATSNNTTPAAKPVSPFRFAQGFSSKVAAKIQPNALNQYWQPTYHFSLFMAGDKDVVGSDIKDLRGLMSKINSNGINRVIIAESGVTGYNIHEVTIDSVNSQTAITREQRATEINMTITEPMGISFLDGLAGAGTLLGVFDYTKMLFFLQLSFTGYREDGSFAHNPLPIGPAGANNGGQWLWALTLANIDVKINEGSAVYSLKFITNDAEALVLEKKAYAAKKSIIAEGKTVSALFDDYAKQLSEAIGQELGKDKQGKSLITFKIDATHPIYFGLGKDKKPGDFKLAPKQPDLSDVRALPLDSPKDGTYTVTVPAGTTVNEFISSTFKSTEEAQALMKDVPIIAETAVSDTQVNAKKYRTSLLFSVEADVQTQDFDKETGNYRKLVTLHVIPTYSQTAILSRADVINSEDPAVQRNRIAELLDQGFLCKQYDYIFTGLNTEVLDFDITFNTAWQAQMPKQFGDRSGFLNEAIQGKKNPDSPDEPQINLDIKTLNSSGGTTYYMEDIMSRLNQGQTLLPISFNTGYHEVEQSAGKGNVQYHRDRSLVGAIFTQKYYATFQTIELSIRGDPYWLGQTNIERQILLRAGGDPHNSNAPPDYSTGNPVFILYFRYPSQLGDDFKPVLKDSAVFNGLYEVVQAKHTFSDGAFKQVLTANRLTQIDLDLAYTADSNATNSDQTASGNPSSNGTGKPSGGTTPGSTTGSNNPSDPRGIRNNNPTNLSYYPGQTNVQGSDGRFGVYPTMEDGVAAAQNQLMLNQSRGADTVTAQISKWAPPNENNTTAYITRVSTELGVGPNDKIDVTDPHTAQVMIGAMAKVENGRSIDSEVIQRGVAKRLGTA